MKLKRLILFGLIISTGILNAQRDFRPGYIIKAVGDTIFGQIDYRGSLSMSSVCMFQDKENKITEYQPNDIIAFRFIDSKYYVSREVNNKKVFLEYLINGKISIYYMRNDTGDHYYIDKEGEKLTEMPYEEGIQKLDNTDVFYQSTKHIGLLRYYMKDAPQLQSRINSVKTLEHNNLIKLAVDYHNAVCDGEKCIIYEKKRPLIGIIPEFIVGIVSYPNGVTDKYSRLEGIDSKFRLQAGIIGHIWMPRVNEKLYFRSGLLFSRPTIWGIKEPIFKVPLQLEYIYPNGFFRPRMAIGANFYFPASKPTASLNLGGNLKLTETLFLSVTSDIEFKSSYSINLGFFLKVK
jgi:hypothetical protein